ncbi:MAG TPA: hypothetical protein VFE16_14520 [Candidatus Cybelea sp.]|nr:hypothetical protein [Candidatus Cybelea sp.]
MQGLKTARFVSYISMSESRLGRSVQVAAVGLLIAGCGSFDSAFTSADPLSPPHGSTAGGGQFGDGTIYTQTP